MEHFQGVVCCCLGDQKVQDTILSILDLETPTKKNDIDCYQLELKNKYYQAKIHLFDHKELLKEELLDDCQGIILQCDGLTVTTGLLDQKVVELERVRGEPRILLCYGLDEDCNPHRTLMEWSIKNGYDLILASDEDVRTQVIDSLSAYKWQFRADPTAIDNKNNGSSSDQKSPQLNDELMKKLMDFDSLLGKLSAYRDQPELRGNPDDKNIVEIAEILSGLLGEDVDEFLENTTESEDRGTTNDTSST